MNRQAHTNNNSDPSSNAASQGTNPSPASNTQLYGKNDPKVQPKDKYLQPEYKPSKSTKYKGLIGLTQIVVGAVVAALFINTFIFQSYEVVGESMHPTLSSGDRLIINKLGKTWDWVTRSDHIPKRGDIIIFDDPTASNRQLVKRVIGLPGDTVRINQGTITITNEENPQGFDPDIDYKDSLAVDTNYTLTDTVTEGHLFVAGDNRIGGASLDSRNDLGLIPIESVVGELVIRLLPLSESRFF